MKELIEKAIEAKKRAYVPYSNFSVGSAVICEDGEIYTGANIENAAFSPTICAERLAIFKAIYDGKKISKIAIVANDYTFPCGVCRQVMREFSEDLEIIIAKSPKDYKTYKLFELLPNSFGKEDLS